jgi:hypothetical protein
MTYAACSWSRPRRIVLVMLEQSDDLLLRHFWLLTSINANTLDGDALLALWRQVDAKGVVNRYPLTEDPGTVGPLHLTRPTKTVQVGVSILRIPSVDSASSRHAPR